MAPLNLDSIITLLSTYDGRDKLLRTAYYAVMLMGSKTAQPLSAKLFDVSRQISSARTVGRRFGDIIMIKANLAHFTRGPGSDLTTFLLNGINNILYQFYYPIEHVAWLSQFKIFPGDQTKWWNYTTMIWATATFISMIRCLRSYFLLLSERKKCVMSEDRANLRRITSQQLEEITTFIMLAADFMNAVHYLPKGFLWSQSLSSTKVAVYGLIASVIGLIKLFKRL